MRRRRLLPRTPAPPPPIKSSPPGLRTASSPAALPTAPPLGARRRYTLSFSEEGEGFGDTLGLSTSQAGAPGGADTMDEDEQFEQLQLDRVMAEEPDSLAFVRARKSVLKSKGGTAGRRLRA